jgi:hypothetical protein
VDETFCREVADEFDCLPRLTYDEALAPRYWRLKRETRLQHQAIIDTGIKVEPWLGPGQPYRDSTARARRPPDRRDPPLPHA